MSLYEENGTGMVMPVAPMYGGGYGNGGFGNGFMGDGSFWILLLFILLGNGAWGNGFGGGFGCGVGGELYPWMNQSTQINDGFRDQMINTSINGIQNSITSGFLTYGAGTPCLVWLYTSQISNERLTLYQFLSFPIIVWH